MMQKLHPPKEEVTRRGKAIYEAQVRFSCREAAPTQVEPEFIGKVVAIC